jgi:hypothetical protein
MIAELGEKQIEPRMDISGWMSFADSRDTHLVQSDLDSIHCTAGLDERAHILVKRKR